MKTILAVAKNRFLNLRHDRAAMILSFVLPVAFFSVFAGVFSGGGRDATRKIQVAIVDEDGSSTSRRLLAALAAEQGLAVLRAPEEKPGAPEYTRATAEAAVRAGDLPVALIVPKGFGATPLSFGGGAKGPTLEILSDSADPVAPQVLGGLVQKVAMTAMPGAMARSGVAEVDQWSGGLTPEQKARMDAVIAEIEKEPEVPPGQAAPRVAGAPGGAGGGLIDVTVRDLVGEKKKNPTIAFYAAGLGVMFLLFSAAGAGGALIEEAESGTLDRILATRVSMTKLLLGKLVYLVLLAVSQLTLMFTWGAIFFGVELASHVPGFLIMTFSTAIACATFGLLLASICRSRMQLVALSNLAILLMSALGGSMFPRFLMPEKMQKIGLATLNAWAIDGFQKIFWRDEPVSSLWPQVTVLVGLGIAFFLVARRVARRWQTA